MNAVIDTNVIAYFLLGTDRFVDEARDFMTALGEGWAPAVWEAELANVLWMATRHKVLSLNEAAKRLRLADSLGVHAVSNLPLARSAGQITRRSRRSTTRYSWAAVREQLPLATFDAALLSLPDVAGRPADIARSSPSG